MTIIKTSITFMGCSVYLQTEDEDMANKFNKYMKEIIDNMLPKPHEYYIQKAKSIIDAAKK